MGNLTEKQAQFALVRKIQKNIKQRVSLIHKQRGKSEKTSPKWANLHKNTPKFCFEVNWRAKVPWNLKKKRNPQNRKLQKNKPKKQANFNQNMPKNKQAASLQKSRKSTKKTSPNSRENRKVGNTASEKFICWFWRNPWCDFYVTHTPECNESAIIRQTINCALTILIASLFSLCRLRITTQLRSGILLTKWPVLLQNTSVKSKW